MPKWRIREHDQVKVEAIARKYNVDKLIATCLINRGVFETRGCECFLEPSSFETPDPFLMPDMDLAVSRILLALERAERICIYGDYDADGVTAISILKQGLSELGADVFYYIPDRFFEGVGLHKERLKRLQGEGVGLVITVDTGVRAFEEMDYAREIGLDVIITDHHTPDETRPNALAVLNPKLSGSRYPFMGLCGAGVAFKLIQALDSSVEKPLNLKKYVQIAAIGTIADMVPLVEENRWLVSRGLKEISQDEASPLRLILKRVGLRGEVDALDISFKVAPRINAPGRLGDPDTAIAFFDSQTAREANELIDIMDGMNTVRQMLEREISEKIEFQLHHSLRGKIPPFIMLAGRHWHRGILD